jgi:cytochrome c-type biogenesis protein CcmH/NrfG
MAPHLSREFLERSLVDLDREYEAGELERADYERLRADYERRLRGEVPPPRGRPRPALVVASVAFVLVVAIVAGTLLARYAGRREAGETITGEVAEGARPPASAAADSEAVPEELARCRSLEPGEAIDCYTAYTDANPDDPMGFVELGLFSINAGIAGDRTELLDAGEGFLRRALELDPDHVPARVYLAVVLERTGRSDAAAEQCTHLASSDVPQDLQTLVDFACG